MVTDLLLDREAPRLGAKGAAFISALAKLARVGHVPVRWSRWTGWFLTHPSIEARARAITREAHIEDAEVDLLLEGNRDSGDPSAPPAEIENGGRLFSTAFKSGVLPRNAWLLLLTAVLAPHQEPRVYDGFANWVLGFARVRGRRRPALRRASRPSSTPLEPHLDLRDHRVALHAWIAARARDEVGQNARAAAGQLEVRARRGGADTTGPPDSWALKVLLLREQLQPGQHAIAAEDVPAEVVARPPALSLPEHFATRHQSRLLNRNVSAITRAVGAVARHVPGEGRLCQRTRAHARDREHSGVAI